MKKKIAFCSFGGYRLFCGPWWSDLVWYVLGISWTASYNRDGKSWWRTFRWRRPGWCGDIFAYWHRARYGWAPRDTWALDYHLNRVLAGSLEHLANTLTGAPVGYGSDNGETTDFEKWEADLRRWALTFSEDPEDVEIYDLPTYEKHWAEETRRRANLQQALSEIAANWGALWN